MAESKRVPWMRSLAESYKDQHADLTRQMSGLMMNLFHTQIAGLMGSMCHQEVFNSLIARPNLSFDVSASLVDVPDLPGTQVSRDLFNAMQKMSQLMQSAYAKPRIEDYQQLSGFFRDCMNDLYHGVKEGDPRFTEYRALLPKYVAFEQLVGRTRTTPFVAITLGTIDHVKWLSIPQDEKASTAFAPAAGSHAVIRPGIYGFYHMAVANTILHEHEPEMRLTIVENDGLVTDTLKEYAGLLKQPRISVLSEDPATTTALHNMSSIMTYLLSDLPDDQITAILENAGRSLRVSGTLYLKDTNLLNNHMQTTAYHAIRQHLRIVARQNLDNQAAQLFEVYAIKKPITAVPLMPPGVAISA